MPADRSELSSLADLLTQVIDRITVMAQNSAKAHEDDEAKELFGIERSLVGAQRRINRLISSRR